MEFAGRHPGVTLNLTVHNREELLGLLADNLTDLAVMARPPSGLDTVNASFAPHPYVIVAPAGHPLAGKRRIPLGRLLRPLLRRMLRGALRRALDNMLLLAEGASVQTVAEARSLA